MPRTEPLVLDVEALQAGDPRALEDALRQLLPRVRRWLMRLLGPRPDLDDATQDALVALAKALPRFEGRSKATTFAHRITVRTAYRYFRRRQREEALTLVPPPPDAIDPESRAMDREALRRLYRCLERLPKKRRVAFVLCCIEGMSPAEAAEVEGISGVAMRSRLSHARAEIARRLDHDPYISRLAGRSS
ncbi:MAG: RNA polymerase sigma factor [Myxococcota bacterium]